MDGLNNLSYSNPIGVSRRTKEQRLEQHGHIVWLFGLSGAGKSTLASALEHRLAAEGRLTVLLDGDILRAGLNRDLGFSDADRAENLRRAAEAAKFLANSGIIVICAFITPLHTHRRLIREIVGSSDLLSVYISASLAVCEKRDTKGLYAKVACGAVLQFTGKDSGFESPQPDEEAIFLDAEHSTIEEALNRLHALVLPRISIP